MSFPIIDILIWLLGAAVHVCLLAVLIIRGRWKDYPLFTSFVIYQNGATIILYLVSRTGNTDWYRKEFWLYEALCFVLEVAVAGEMFTTIWRESGGRALVSRYHLVYAGLFSLLLASVSAFTVGSVTMDWINLLAMRGAIFTSFMLCGCFIAASFEANALGLRRSRHPMMIGWGLTGIALLELSEDFRFFSQGWHQGNDILDRVTATLYACIVLCWAVEMWRDNVLTVPRSRLILQQSRNLTKV